MAQNPIPRPNNPDNPIDQFQTFVELVRILRRECPWDRKQTHETISHLLVEEVYETLEAIKEGNDGEFSKELGDLLLHIVMHSVIAEERGAFGLTDIIQQEFNKLVSRHPHVFGDVTVQDDHDVKKNWEELKMKEGRSSVIEGLPSHLPALLRAQRLQEKVSNVGFDWEDRNDVWKKVEEELHELKDELHGENKQAAFEEFGDLLFALINAARFEDIVAEEALQHTNNKFIRRFQYIEKKAAEQKRSLRDMTLGEMDTIWNEAKEIEKGTHGSNSH